MLNYCFVIQWNKKRKQKELNQKKNNKKLVILDCCHLNRNRLSSLCCWRFWRISTYRRRDRNRRTVRIILYALHGWSHFLFGIILKLISKTPFRFINPIRKNVSKKRENNHYNTNQLVNRIKSSWYTINEKA